MKLKIALGALFMLFGLVYAQTVLVSGQLTCAGPNSPNSLACGIADSCGTGTISGCQGNTIVTQSCGCLQTSNGAASPVPPNTLVTPGMVGACGIQTTVVLDCGGSSTCSSYVGNDGVTKYVGCGPKACQADSDCGPGVCVIPGVNSNSNNGNALQTYVCENNRCKAGPVVDCTTAFAGTTGLCLDNQCLPTGCQSDADCGSPYCGLGNQVVSRFCNGNHLCEPKTPSTFCATGQYCQSGACVAIPPINTNPPAMLPPPAGPPPGPAPPAPSIAATSTPSPSATAPGAAIPFIPLGPSTLLPAVLTLAILLAGRSLYRMQQQVPAKK